MTVFLTTHYMDEAERVAHRIAIIDHGRIVAQGSSAELKQQSWPSHDAPEESSNLATSQSRAIRPASAPRGMVEGAR